jgi:glycosyltransferase involved in cell wall biosynthesis
VKNPIRVLELLVTMSPGGGPKQVYDVVRYLPREEFEVVVAARWAGVPAVHTFHGIHYRDYPPLGQVLYLGLERALSRLTHTIINVSASQEAEGLQLRIFRPSQSVVIVNGIDFEEMGRLIATRAIRRESLGLIPDDLVLGSVTRFDPIKRVERLLEALRLLAPRIPRLHLLLVGGGGEEERIRRLVLEMGLGRRVIFTGFLENSVRVFPVLDLYVATSLKEGLPLSLVEAMGAGLAVVATDVPGHRDVMIHGETGFLVPVEDPRALADAISSLLADPEARRRKGEAGRHRALKEFSIHPMVEGTAEAYRRASGGR